MELTAEVAADLAVLAAALYDPGAALAPDVANTIRLLATDARLAVPSYLGLTVTATVIVPEDATPDRVVLRVTVLDHQIDPSDIETSLRLPGPADHGGLDAPSIEVVLYAATPGAFVDMAADLSFLTGLELDADDFDQLRSLARESDRTGVLQAEAATHEAIGVLIARGRTRQQAAAELDSLAAAVRTDWATEAARILSTITRGVPDVVALGTPGADLT